MKRHANRSKRRCPQWRQEGVSGQERRRGTTIAEFAIVAPIFFVLLFAGIEFSVLSTIRSTANNAAYEGARKLVIPGAAAATGITEAQRIMAIVGVDVLTVAVTPSTLTDETREVTVQISIPYANNAIIAPWFTGGLVINSQSTLRTERYGGIGGS